MTLDEYPFGLKHKGYNNVILSEHNYGYNGKEEQNELNLNTYDLGARQMDPALGRFMTIDPMADFVNYQSPYALADNNPIRNVDEYGLGSGLGDWLRKIFGGRRLKCGVRGRTKSRKARKPRRTRTKRKKKTKPSNNPVAVTDPRGPIDPINTQAFGITEISSSINVELPVLIPTLNSGQPNEQEIKFNGVPIPSGSNVSFNKDVKFNSSSSNFRDVNHTEKILSDLIKTLKEYPQLKVLILGNFSNPRPGITINSSARVNGQSGTIGGLQLQRARAVERFLIGKGINWRRILVGNGRINSGGTNGMNSTFIIKNE